MSSLIRPIFWTCATDAAGFFALSISRIVPIQQFGVMIAVAAMAVFIAILLFAGLAMSLPGRKHVGRLSGGQRQLTGAIRRVCLAVANRSTFRAKSLGVVAILIAVWACLGLGRMESETSFLNNFRRDSSIAQAYREVEMNFGGAGVWDVVVEAPLELTDTYLDQVRQLEAKLREIEVDGARLTKVLSVADAEAVVKQSSLAALLPASSRLSFMYVALPGFFDALLSQPEKESRQLRIMLRSREQLEPGQKSRLIAEVTRVVKEHTSTAAWKDASGGSDRARVTGYHILMARLIDQLIGDQWRCFATSALLVWLLLVLATRSLRLASAALIPNLLPILAVLALVGLVGGRINMGAAMIAAVSIGISIDGSVHLLLNYQRHRLGGHSVQRSTLLAAAKIGVPVLLATCALILGFGALATSKFVPTATFGLLVAITLSLGTLVNLTLLPALIVMIEPDGKSVVPEQSPVV